MINSSTLIWLYYSSSIQSGVAQEETLGGGVAGIGVVVVIGNVVGTPNQKKAQTKLWGIPSSYPPHSSSFHMLPPMSAVKVSQKYETVDVDTLYRVLPSSTGGRAGYRYGSRRRCRKRSLWASDPQYAMSEKSSECRLNI